METFEVKLKIYLLRDIRQEEALSVITSFIDEALYQYDDTKQFLEEEFRNYVFCSLYPVAYQHVYAKDYVYSIIIRTIVPSLASFFLKDIKNYNNYYMKGLTCEIKRIDKRLIDRIYSITPIVIKGGKGAGYWKRNMTFEEFERRFKDNLIKKYYHFTGKKIDENFILYDSITFLNQSPIRVSYKDASFLGDKIELRVSDNTAAQNLVYMGLGTGLCESNERGFGFVNFQWYKEVQS